MPRDPLPPLDKLDPTLAWKPWVPDARDPFDAIWAAHLYRRAAFGASPETLRKAVARGLPATIDLLLAGEPDPKEPPLNRFLMEKGEAVAKRDNIGELRSWWLYCMLHTLHPLREKLTLFWHNHFATSNAKVQNARMMFAQNKLFRENALGKFEPFLLAVSKDPAMLVWLDSNDNIKGKANENYARELMELFSLGVGHYTEKDVREGARAFTGWHANGENFEFNAHFHDNGVKTFLGARGNLDGGDVVRIVLEQPAAARFLVGKLYRFLISEADVPPAPLVEPLADSFRKSDYDIAGLVRTILSSRLFFSQHAFRQKIKSPVEYVLGAVQTVAPKDVPPRPLASWIDRMGQQLFAPPNVKGWREGKAWLTTTTILARENFAQQLAMGTLWGRSVPGGGAIPVPVPTDKAPAARERPEEPPPSEGYDPVHLVPKEALGDPARAVDALLAAFVPGGVDARGREKLIAFVSEGKPEGEKMKRRLREATHAILAMPEAQLS
jgi:hypothetical protein